MEKKLSLVWFAFITPFIANLAAAIFCWALGVLFVLFFYHKDIENNFRRVFYITVLSVLPPFALDYFLLPTEFRFVGKLFYCFTPILSYSIYYLSRIAIYSYEQHRTGTSG